MDLLQSIKNLLGLKPVNIGQLNTAATSRLQNPSVFPKPRISLEDIQITDEYKKVLQIIESGYPIVFITGKAGTGKSTLIQYIRHSLPDKRIVSLAPTGVAALNISGATIHSFFRFKPKVIDDDDITQVADRKLYSVLDIIIIDEVSMLRADLLDGIDKFLRLNGPSRNTPFGGVQLLFIGDLFQLPPVVTREEEGIFFGRNYTSEYFFSGHSLQNYNLVPYELTEVFRQHDSHFLNLLDNLRMGKDLDLVIPEINNACYHSMLESNATITLVCTNNIADSYNLRELARLPGKEYLYRGEVRGSFRLKDDNLPAPLNLTLKVGAQVMFVKNDPQKRWVNGTLGKVREVRKNSVLVELITDHAGTKHEVQRVTWQKFKYEYDYTNERIKTVPAGEFSQLPLILAWAVTIHKGQGKTLDSVRLDLGQGAFASGQAYVALSRCKSLVDISLVRPIKPEDVICDQRVLRFYEALFPKDNFSQLE
jgi:ATP-dependent DNA helicase PIF1